MRSDVNKVLTECYKEVSNYGSKKFPRTFEAERFDEVGGKVGMHHVHQRATKHMTKSFGENLAYLPRFLNKNIGRSWDAIYSEVTKNFDRRSTVNDHIFQHLFDYVVEAKDLMEIEGKLYFFSKFRTEPFPLDEAAGFTGELYVDPRDGILKKNLKYKTYKQVQAAGREKNKQEAAAKKKVLSPFEELHLIKNKWYLFTIKPIPEPEEHWVFPMVSLYLLNSDQIKEQLKRYKEFRAMSAEDKQRFGKCILVQTYKKGSQPPSESRSPLTYDKTEVIKRGKHRESKTILPTHYYASMRSASKKELRAVGL